MTPAPNDKPVSFRLPMILLAVGFILIIAGQVLLVVATW